MLKGNSGQVRGFVQFVRGPGSLLGNPALLAGAAGIMAQVAMQQGSYAAKSIFRRVIGHPALPPFRYFDKGSLAVIGRASAVANTFGLHLSGFLAWLVWVFIHLMYLVTFQNRLKVFIQWAIQDITFNRGARLITGIAPTDFNFNSEVSGQRGAVEASPAPATSDRGK